MGITYEQLTGDLTGVNYSSIRAGLLEFRRRCEQFQHQVIVFQMCRPIWRAWIDAAVLAQAVLRRSLETRPASRRKESRHRRWRGMDLEHRQRSLPRSCSTSTSSTPASNCGSWARLVFSSDTKSRNQWIALHQKRWLDKGKIAKLVTSLRSIQTADPELAKKIRNEADYFANNAARMDYPKFRKQHLFVGSGVIEAGCETVVAHRLKQYGMFWTVRGANAILALCCSHLNGGFEDYWEERRAAYLHFYVAHPRPDAYSVAAARGIAESERHMARIAAKAQG